jgi:hypothetical protein
VANDFQEFKEALRGEFTVRFDKQSSVLRLSMGRDEYSTFRALCFEWYLNGFFDALTDGEGDEMREALQDAADGRTTPIEEVRAKLRKAETIH